MEGILFTAERPVRNASEAFDVSKKKIAGFGQDLKGFFGKIAKKKD
jgi:hypothetical protein